MPAPIQPDEQPEYIPPEDKAPDEGAPTAPPCFQLGEGSETDAIPK